jgi:hypothetical protein
MRIRKDIMAAMVGDFLLLWLVRFTINEIERWFNWRRFTIAIQGAGAEAGALIASRIGEDCINKRERWSHWRKSY